MSETFRPRLGRSLLAALTLGGMLGVFAMGTPPALALYPRLSNTLDGPAIGGVVPSGAARIDQCKSPGSSFDLNVTASNVNLPNGTVLTVTYGGHGTQGQDQFNDSVPIGTFALSGGAGSFAVTRPGQAGANDNIFVKRNGSIVLAGTDRWDAGTSCTPPASGPVHVGNISGTPFDLDNPDGWSAQASVGVKRSNGAAAKGATVSGQFTARGGYSFTGSCVTFDAGFCSINAGGIPPSASQVTFTVTNVEHLEGDDPSANAQTTITITKPAG